ncbi:hypothetical protein B1B04_17115 [Lysinibacillus sp. KCTC 33748]|uniref:hypothetical protein n=1 Tax=unclassified Lysinibacillus TaxID=2636778 RepID=UPI0009A6CD17|nr:MULTISPECIES: hypothetical protein [unclassified Lysinibacillus]OXS72219.1 hypothetical protein B1B04_17115 [Lysinibacillus sp. KCTC 33748]SKB98751.1 hypothetical protein SAMN06295926_11584 [Lysinibacillus sp. AC-3]
MIEQCKCDETYDLRVEADIGADAIWCNKCLCNFEISYVPISIELQSELTKWILKYGEWIDWANDEIVPIGIELEEIHNQQGLKLTEKVRKELEGKYKVSFSPSTFAKRHANKKK